MSEFFYQYCCPEAQDVQEGPLSGTCSCFASFSERKTVELGNELCPVLSTFPTVMLSWERVGVESETGHQRLPRHSFVPPVTLCCISFFMCSVVFKCSRAGKTSEFLLYLLLAIPSR